MNQFFFRCLRGSLHLHIATQCSQNLILISGENGSGKTTFLRCLAGLEEAKGTIIVQNTLWLDSEKGFVLPTEKRHIGCVWSDATLLPWLSVKENILLGVKKYDESFFTKLATGYQIASLMQRQSSMLSTGEAQRVALVRALYRKPDILLLDEPFSAQAPDMRKGLRLCLKAMQQELQMLVVMVSHDKEDARVLAQKQWYMREGRLFTQAEKTVRKEKQL